MIGTDCIGSYKSNYHTIVTTTVPVKREVIVRFVDSDGIDDHHCLNFLFIITLYKEQISQIITYTIMLECNYYS